MFCINCGEKLIPDTTFCASCGKSASPQPNADSGTPLPPVFHMAATYLNKNIKIIVIVVLSAIVLFAAYRFFIGGGSSSDLSGTWVAMVNSDYLPEITFRNNNFTAVGYGYEPWRGCSNAQRDFVRHLDWNSIYRRTSHGTFSVTDNQIELVYSDGSIEVLGFSRTENTIEITTNRSHSNINMRFTRR